MTTTEKTTSFKSNWYFWLFPLLAIAFSGWLMMKYFEERGLPITISFEDASAISAEKTKVLYRGVIIGTVNKITISEDNQTAIAHIILKRDAEHFAVEGSKFWVVSPKVGMQGITGLETIFQGTYITVEPGKADGAVQTEFKGSLSSESSESYENTSAYYLETNNVESISTGDSVTFRGIKVGSVSDVTLNKTGQLGVVKINIENKYVRLVRTNSFFWRKVGIQADLGLFGSKIKVNSFDSIMRGGVELWTPDSPGPIAKYGTRFNINPGPPKNWEKWNPKLENP